MIFYQSHHVLQVKDQLRTVGTNDAKDRLSKYLRRAADEKASVEYSDGPHCGIKYNHEVAGQMVNDSDRLERDLDTLKAEIEELTETQEDSEMTVEQLQEILSNLQTANAEVNDSATMPDDYDAEADDDELGPAPALDM